MDNQTHGEKTFFHLFPLEKHKVPRTQNSAFIHLVRSSTLYFPRRSYAYNPCYFLDE